MRCHPRFFSAAYRIASRSSASCTRATSPATFAGSRTATGAVRTVSSRVLLRSGASTVPTRNRNASTGTPRARSCAMMGSPSIDNSCAHVALATRTCRTPRSSFAGMARAAIRVPTAASQSRADTGARASRAVLGGKISLARSSTTPSCSIPRSGLFFFTCIYASYVDDASGYRRWESNPQARKDSGF
jgi:hypothetical protein